MGSAKKMTAQLSLIETMGEAIESGRMSNALALVQMLPGELDAAGDLQRQTWDLFEMALDADMPELALALYKEGKVHNFDLSSAMDMIGEKDCSAAVLVFAGEAGRDGLLRCAYHAAFERNQTQTGSSALAMASKMLSRDWKDALQDGLQNRWDRREKKRYELACEELKIPLWNACAGLSVLDLAQTEEDRLAGKEQPEKVEDMRHNATALDLPHEYLLWGSEAVCAFERESEKRAGDPLWRADLLDSAIKGWHAANAALPRAKKAIGAARRGKKDKSGLESLGKHLAKEGAQPWVPFMLAWCEHQGFSDSDKEDLAPLLKVARIDARNAGLIAANLEYGSFNARIARIAMHLRQIGNMDDGAVLVARARIEDLWENPAMRKFLLDSSFVEDLKQARMFFGAEAERIVLSKVASEAPSGPKRPKASI